MKHVVLGRGNYREMMSTQKYTRQSVVTSPGEYAYLYDSLPDAVPEIVKVVQGLVIDKDFLELYGVPLSEERKVDIDSRYMEVILERLLRRDSRELARSRDPVNRFMGSCRDYAVVLCST
jgi:hypothetical protein